MTRAAAGSHPASSSTGRRRAGSPVARRARIARLSATYNGIWRAYARPAASDSPTRRPVNDPGPRAATTPSISSGLPPARFTTASRRTSTGGSPRSLTQSSAASRRRPSRTTSAWSTPEVSIARRTKHRPDPVRPAQEGQAPPRFCLARQPDPDRRPVVEHAGTVRPLDDRDRVGRRFVQAAVDPSHPIQTIEVVVLDGDTALVVVVQDERRAVHAAPNAQGLRDALHQLRLSRAQVTFERDDVSGLEDLSQAATELAGLFDRRGLNESVHSRRLRAFPFASRCAAESPVARQSRPPRSMGARCARGRAWPRRRARPVPRRPTRSPRNP